MFFRNTHHVSSKIDAENSYCTEWQRDITKDKGQERRYFRNVRRQGVGNGFFQIVKDQTSFFHSRDDRSEIVIQQDHIGSLFGHIGSRDAHGDTYVRFFQGRRVVHTVA